jgi:hypothetical protein
MTLDPRRAQIWHAMGLGPIWHARGSVAPPHVVEEATAAFEEPSAPSMRRPRLLWLACFPPGLG